ncbi:hypothetical protein [Roseateles saccharophilus]|uniref:Uncharacterized protein n=1 Tax=Roseateles saccharophilus TaxID=304 RepID=A0A4R3V1M2_ROSSA|nr:hypothetical protein [Roseateles saccharophilus]MDG0832001.1 hypothetical protein [Roseateles saccharophilus]TCU97331.1 hypothetical protein EV671_10114 [Roseateles saccharophilus]
MRPHLIALSLVAVLSACASSSQDKVATAATTPLSDLNVVRADIPDVLKAAAAAPYALPADASCAVLAAGVHALDEVLGPDLDAPASAGSPGLLDRGEDAATGALQRTAEGVIPFRGWVRKLSGAERYARHVSAAITAGGVRRGYLKGLAAAKACPVPPAAPASGAPR